MYYKCTFGGGVIMDKRALELIYGISDEFSENPQTVSSNLYKLTEIFSDLIFKKNNSDLVELKRILEDELVTKVVKDYCSYNLGKAHVLMEMINFLNKPFELQTLIKSLKENEKKILKLIGEKQELTPSQIRTELFIDNKQYLSNLLGGLRNQDLVNAYTVGKYRWYSLTFKGKDVLKTLDEEDTEHYRQLFKLEKLSFGYEEEYLNAKLYNDTNFENRLINSKLLAIEKINEIEVNHNSLNIGMPYRENYLEFEEEKHKFKTKQWRVFYEPSTEQSEEIEVNEPQYV